jgi:hypothetical protein
VNPSWTVRPQRPRRTYLLRLLETACEALGKCSGTEERNLADEIRTVLEREKKLEKK